MADSARTGPGIPFLLPAGPRTLTMGFAVSYAGDKFLVGVFSNPAIEQATAVPSGLLEGWRPLGTFYKAEEE